MFLYLTTTGRVTGRPHQIEIWFTEYRDRFYVIAEHGERAQWVRNLRAQPRVNVSVGGRQFDATARAVRDDDERDLAATVKALSQAKYGWSDGLVIELTPVGDGPANPDRR